MSRENLSKIFIDKDEQIYIDGQKIKGLFAYRLENSADLKEPAKLTITMYVSIEEKNFELQK